jgi:uncharacterized protein (DUF2344 family)
MSYREKEGATRDGRVYFIELTNKISKIKIQKSIFLPNEIKHRSLIDLDEISISLLELLIAATLAVMAGATEAVTFERSRRSIPTWRRSAERHPGERESDKQLI